MKLLKSTILILVVSFFAAILSRVPEAISNSGSVRGFMVDPVGDLFAFLRDGSSIRMSGKYTPTFTATGWSFSNSTGSYLQVGQELFLRVGTSATGARTGILNFTLPKPRTTNFSVTNSIRLGQGNGECHFDTPTTNPVVGFQGKSITADSATESTGVSYTTAATGIGCVFSYSLN